MIPLYTEEEFKKATSRKTPLPLKCKGCQKTFYKTKCQIQGVLNPRRFEIYDFCSRACKSKQYQDKYGKYQFPKVEISCDYCGEKFGIERRRIKHAKHHFCTLKCANIHSNIYRKNPGCKRSKLEIWLESQLPQLYPNLVFRFNRKDAINSELDIYIPELKLAFELNGIFHYEPIYGNDQLTRVKNNDQRKILACAERGISLCVIDSSHQQNFTPKTSQQFLDIICNIINNAIKHFKC